MPAFLEADALIVLDEAHLVPPFEELLRAVAEDVAFRPGDLELRKVVPAFKLLPLSATGRTVDAGVFGLTPKDLENKIVKKRLDAKKHLGIVPLKHDAKLEEELAQRAWDLSCDGQSTMRCIVFCNERRVLEKAKGAVEKLAKGDKKAGKAATEIDTELLVGGRRVFEREQARERLNELGFVASSKAERNRPAFLFATSAGEVGIDLNADHMSCDLVAWERMVQRFGRVNRRGTGEARVVVLVEPEPRPNKKEAEALKKQKDGEELDEKMQKLVAAYETRIKTWRAVQAPLKELPKNSEFLNASPGALRDLRTRAQTDPKLREILDAATSPAPLRPTLSRALADAWSMTSLKEHTGRPAINPWLRGWIEDEPPQTAIVWRTHLPLRVGGAPPTCSEIETFFEAAPPHTSEILETETFRVVEWLEKRAEALLSSSSVIAQEGDARMPAVSRDSVVAFMLAPDGDLRGTRRLGDLIVSKDKNGKKALQDTLAGATLLLDARLAGLKDGLLNDEEGATPKTADDGDEWLGQGVVRFRVRSADAGATPSSGGQWYERLRFATDISEDGEPQRWLVVDKMRHDAATEEDRSAGHPQLLDEHQSWAEGKARALAKALGLDDYGEMLAVSARFHDEGKRAKRWQRSFNAPTDGVYAKTEGPINYSLLDGYRHELGSLPSVEKNERFLALPPDQRELTLHLIAAHHGFARAVIGTDGCEDVPPSKLQERAREIALRFARLQHRWGPWGLAWWESLLRAADQQASRDNNAKIPRKYRG